MRRGAALRAGLALLLLAMAAPASAAVLLDASGQRQGTVTLQDGTLRLAGEAVALAAGDRLVFTGHPASLARPQLVHLRSGERWSVRLMGIAAGELDLIPPLGNRRTLPVTGLAAIDFVLGLPPPRQDGAVLERQAGEDLAGELLWSDGEHLLLGSRLGPLRLALADCRRYRREAPASLPREGDEIGLVDGSVLCGVLRLEDDRVLCSGSALGELRLPLSALRYLVRDRSRELPRLVRCAGAAGPAPQPFDRCAVPVAWQAAPFAHGQRLPAGGSYEVAAPAAGLLRLRLAPVHGPTRVELRTQHADGVAAVHHDAVVAAATPLALRLRAGEVLRIVVGIAPVDLLDGRLHGDGG